MDDEFKVPGLPVKAPEEKPKVNNTESDEKKIEQKNILEFPYKIPKWDGPTSESPYSFEVLKNGVIIEEIKNLNTKSFWTIGRLNQGVDLVAAHPSVSRFHAVLQYKKSQDEADSENNIEDGWFIYDLDSTHGTFINKMRVRPKTYVRLRVGHQIKFGNSTRNFILTGPTEDEEEASEFSITELKEQKVLKEAELKQKQLEELAEMEKKKAEEGVSWGMSEDAEEESDLTENPFAMTTNEEFFVKDPKKTLRGFYEREGLNLEYKCDELSAGSFICKVELPIDDELGNEITCEVKHKGKKKECVELCALEACRILDRHGMLRQATHEPRRSKKYEEDDSDDDGFYDRTGDVEKKKMKKTNQNQSEALTYEQLNEQKCEIMQKISEKEKQLSDLIKAEKSQRQTDDDDLESFMSNLNKIDSKVDKFAISSMKSDIQRMKVELQKIEKLVEIARPSLNLHSIVKTNKSALPLFGKRTALGRNFLTKKPDKIETKQKVEEEFEVEEDDEEEENVKDDEKEGQKAQTQQNILNIKHEEKVEKMFNEPATKKQKLEEEGKIQSEIKDEEPRPEVQQPSTSEEQPPQQPKEKKRKNRIRIKNQYRQNVDMNDDDEFIDEEKVSTWVPPNNQQGDGMTHLNAKFGY